MRKTLTPDLKSGVDRIILLLIGCFVLQAAFALITPNQFSAGTHFDFLGFKFSTFTDGFVWNAFSYSLLNESIFVLIMNLIGLHFIGRPVEQDIGFYNFSCLCFISCLSGAFTWGFFHNIESSPLCGFTPVLMSILSFFCFRNQERPITLLLFFLLPLTIKPKFLLLGLLCIELFSFVFVELQGNEGINSSAHLGGLLSGALTYLLFTKGKEFPKFVFRFNMPKSKRKFKANTGKPAHADSTYSVNLSDQHSLQVEVDRILDKITEKGFGSLNSDEKNTLEKAKGLLNKD